MTTNTNQSSTKSAGSEGWLTLPCGGSVLMRDGVPVRVSDGGDGRLTEVHFVRAIAILGWSVTLGEWTVSDEPDATAPVVAARTIR
jgi:hypothetical protein